MVHSVFYHVAALAKNYNLVGYGAVLEHCFQQVSKTTCNKFMLDEACTTWKVTDPVSFRMTEDAGHTYMEENVILI